MDAVSKGFEGDVVRRAEAGNGSAQEELAKFQLLKEKLQLRASTAAGDKTAKEVLGQLSEEEKVAIKVLKILNQFPESSAEAAQVAEQTQTRNRFAQARYIAERIVAQQRAKSFYDTYGPDKDKIRAQFITAAEVGLARRTEALKDSKSKAELKRSGAAALTAALSGLASGRPGGASASATATGDEDE